MRSLRSTWIIVSLAIGLSIGFSALIALTSGLTHDNWNDTVRNAFDPVLTTNSGSLFGCILLIVLGVTAVTSEYSSRMIRTTFIGNPRRMQVFAAKDHGCCPARAGDHRDQHPGDVPGQPTDLRVLRSRNGQHHRQRHATVS